MSAFNDKRVFNPIDLSRLPFPDVVEALDFEAILAAMLADLRQRDPAFSATVESDPAYKILEAAAYRETLLRQRVNDAARAVMLAYATGSNLDHLAAFFGVGRLASESDSRLRVRAQLAVEGYTTAGPVGSYVFHALGASERVKDVDVTSPSPGHVLVTVLSTEGDGTPAAELLTAVDAALNDETVRPLTDYVTVQVPSVIPYMVDATLYLYEGPDAETVRQVAETRVQAYIDDHHRLGHDIAISGLHQALHVEGAVQRVELASPAETLVVEAQAVAYNTALSVTVGGLDE